MNKSFNINNITNLPHIDNREKLAELITNNQDQTVVNKRKIKNLNKSNANKILRNSVRFFNLKINKIINIKIY